MKKWTMGIGAGLLAIGLAACGDTAEPAEDAGQETAVSDMTLEEVFTKSMEASESVDSLHADMVTSQRISMGEEGMEADMEMTSSMDMTLEPLAFYQQSETIINSEDIQNDNPANTMEMYFSEEDGLFLYEPFMAEWLQIPDEGLEGLTTMADQQAAQPSMQLEQLEAFKDDFTFEQNDSEYILTLNGAGEEFRQLLEGQVEQTFSEMQVDMQTLLEDMEVHSVMYKLFIDKDTFMTNRMEMEMDMDMNIEGETMNIQSDMTADYSEYNEIGDITVPEEVKESAASAEWP